MQNFHVLIKGEYCPIVGRVSMDQITVRLPEELSLGTKVTLIGRDGEKEITATEIADYRGTITYEVVCLLSDRIPRDYVGKNKKAGGFSLKDPFFIKERRNNEFTPTLIRTDRRRSKICGKI